MNELPPITMLPCQSSSVSSVGYCAETQRLAVKFKNGATYHYAGVAPETHAALSDAKSMGGYLRSNVMGKYTHEKIK